MWAVILATVGGLWTVSSRAHARHRESILDLYKKLDEHEKEDNENFKSVTKDMNDKFNELMRTINTNHVEMLKSIPKRKDDL